MLNDGLKIVALSFISKGVVVGRRPFTLFKLRTMREHSLSRSALWTQPGDNRITFVGQFLRPLRLDELPQLLNVLSGEMVL